MVPGGGRHATSDVQAHADAILDRLVHNAHRIELNGESLRRAKPTLGA